MAEETPHSLNPLALSQSWGQDEHDDIHTAPLIALEEVLETSRLRRGISREQLLSELLRDLDHRRLIPLIGMLPRGWRIAPAVLPERLRGIATLLEDGLLSPLLLAALADDLQHLLPTPENQPPSALELWRQPSVALKPGHGVGVPSNLKNCRLLANQPITSDALFDRKQLGRTPLGKGLTAVGSGLVWHNEGLVMLQNESSQRMNELMAQVLNCLAANRLPEALHHSEPFLFEGLSSGRQLIELLNRQGWHCCGRIRASVASFGLGASQAKGRGRWLQVPLAMPYRTGLEDDRNQEILSLLPHCSFELELQPQDNDSILLQYCQGIEGMNGWVAMNDLHRPWQNDRHNGTVAYPSQPSTQQRLADAIEITELIAAVHNVEASSQKLHLGGYGALGYCIDSTALLEQCLNGSTHLFPLTLGGIWRERLRRRLDILLDQGFCINTSVVDRYRWGLDTLPQDLNLQGSARLEAMQRLSSCQPSHSPFALVRSLNGEVDL
ncbi:hypothetical protein [Prochlorococcus marinus]|uniref:Possible Arginine repressor, C-terminal domain n=1 Tax=Prochlorococcus marinus (strain MIT 9303) TaxID=59922 RepID=A2CAT7_PROM3|nr:hypothetical protein [Prochlorococcus marinus]ABM78597.1 possible Arginine repressor, C-terminal domain [Prochlorococcus marinus str. MIT 9303]